MMFRSQPLPPDDETLATGVMFQSCIDRTEMARRGVLLDASGTVVSRYEPQPNPRDRHVGNPFSTPDMVFCGDDGSEQLRIQRVSLMPSEFQACRAGDHVGTIRLTSVLRNRYAVLLEGAAWTIRMPLYRTAFWGEADTHGRVWIEVGPSKMQWTMLFDAAADVRLVAPILAFIHTQWWNCA